jgi:hypothetical protein
MVLFFSFAFCCSVTVFSCIPLSITLLEEFITLSTTFVTAVSNGHVVSGSLSSSISSPMASSIISQSC